jgi:hypothetical protein
MQGIEGNIWLCFSQLLDDVLLNVYHCHLEAGLVQRLGAGPAR